MQDWRHRTGRFQTASSFPKMVGNLFWEHGHRMVATTVGFLTVCFTVYLHRGEFFNWLYRHGSCAPRLSTAGARAAGCVAWAR